MARNLERWIELEDGYLTNQPMIWVRSGRKSERVPDPEHPPTEAWMFVYDCTRTKRGRVQRSRRLETLRAESAEHLEERIMEFCERPDVIHIAAQRRPLEYRFSGCEPVPMEDGATP
jgi:hypothetical protein